jgi:hypothetical protein
MKTGQKIILLFVALLLPGCIFLFLKIFGRNEFAVEPLFQKEAPALPSPCGQVVAPYIVSSERLSGLIKPTDSLAIVFLSKDSIGTSSSRKTFTQLKEEYEKDPVALTMKWPANDGFDSTFHCTFAMKKPNDIALVDNHGVIRGQYESTDRDEIDRLKT